MFMKRSMYEKWRSTLGKQTGRAHIDVGYEKVGVCVEIGVELI